MGRETRGSGSLTRVAIDTAATNGAKDARMSCAISILCVQAAAAGAQHETDAHAHSDWFIRFASDLRLCTLRCGGRARVQSHQWRCDVRGLQRCIRTDLSGSDTILQILPTLVWNYSVVNRQRTCAGCSHRWFVDGRRMRPHQKREERVSTTVADATPAPASRVAATRG